MKSLVEIVNKKTDEKGSITLFVLIAMMFFLVVSFSIYFANQNRISSQTRDIDSIEKAYNNKDRNTIFQEQQEKAKNAQNSNESIIEASKILPSDYGKEIKKGYTCKIEQENPDKKFAWRIFYAYESNVYLIADDYINYQDAPNGMSDGTSEEPSISYDTRTPDPYLVGFSRVSRNYSGTDFIKNTKGNKWLKKYLEKHEQNNSDNNAKASAYLMDTERWGNKFGNDNLAEYTIRNPYN